MGFKIRVKAGRYFDEEREKGDKIRLTARRYPKR